MKIQVFVKLRTGPGKVESYAARRLRFAVARFGDRVPSARVWIVDGQPGTIDVECLVELVIKGGDELSVETVAASPYAAIDMAAARVRKSVERALTTMRSGSAPPNEETGL